MALPRRDAAGRVSPAATSGGRSRTAGPPWLRLPPCPQERGGGVRTAGATSAAGRRRPWARPRHLPGAGPKAGVAFEGSRCFVGWGCCGGQGWAEAQSLLPQGLPYGVSRPRYCLGGGWVIYGRRHGGRSNAEIPRQVRRAHAKAAETLLWRPFSARSSVQVLP